MCTICQAMNPTMGLTTHSEWSVPSTADASVVPIILPSTSAMFIETTDAPANSSTLYSLGDDDVFSGSVDTSGDQDWIEITLAEGAHLTVVQDNISLGNTNTLIRLVDASGTQIYTTSNGGSETYFDQDESTIIYYNDTGSEQTVYVVAAGYSGSTGDYTVTAQIQEFDTGSNEEIVEYLTTGWIGTQMAFDVGVGDTITYDISDLDADEQLLAVTAMEAWSSVIGINFAANTTGTAGITFSNDVNGNASGFNAFAGPTSISNNVINASSITITSAWVDFYGNEFDSYSFQTYLHEIGHALGITHSGPYDSVATYSNVAGGDNIFTNDSTQYTVMSYFDPYQLTGGDFEEYNVLTPMMLDILAMQELYGVAGNIRDDDTTYGYNSTVGGFYDLLAGIGPYAAFTLLDDGGIDTIDLSGSDLDYTINMAPGSFSSVGLGTDNFAIFETTVIENYIGGTGADIVSGNNANNTLWGGAGSDILSGGSGNDTIQGGAGADTLHGDSGSYDMLSYEDSSLAVSVSLLGEIISGGDATGDVIDGFENLEGSAQNDLLGGDNQNNTIIGGNGDDIINGRNGNDSLFGGNDNSVDTISGQFGDDTIYGGGGNDLLFGGAGRDTVFGGAGDDQIQGGASVDNIYGGSDTDTVRYNSSTAAVSVNLSDYTSNSGGDAEGDYITGVENLVGTQFGDTLIGDGAANKLDGFAGDDILMGGGGADILIGFTGFDTADFSDSLEGIDVGLFRIGTGGTSQGDTLLTIEGIIGSDFNDTLVGAGIYSVIRLDGGDGDDLLFDYGGKGILNGGKGNDTMIGRLGADEFDGGEGIDVVRYADAVGAVIANLSTGMGSGADAEGDTYVNVENLVGSRFFDTIIGDDEGNRLEGLAGRDTITGGKGDDQLYGGADLDTFVFDTNDWGNDIIYDFDANPGREKMDMSALGITFADLTIVDTAFGVRVNYNDPTTGVQTIALGGVDLVDITADDFLF